MIGFISFSLILNDLMKLTTPTLVRSLYSPRRLVELSLDPRCCPVESRPHQVGIGLGGWPGLVGCAGLSQVVLQEVAAALADAASESARCC
jgi:hypothetical protein